MQFAEAGYHTIAIDYYTRELGREPRPVENGMAAMQSMDMANVDTDAKAAVAWLRALPGVDIDAVFAVGFCLGTDLRQEIEARAQGDVERIVDAVTAALEQRFGAGPIDTTMRAQFISAAG